MKFGVGREKRRSGGGKKGKRQVLINKNPTSEKPESPLLREVGPFFPKTHMFSLIFRKHATSEKQKTASIFFGDGPFP